MERISHWRAAAQRPAGSMRRAWSRTAVVAVATLVLALGACSGSDGPTIDHNVKAGPNPFTSTDPVLTVDESSSSITSAGGSFVRGDVSLAVPAGAVAAGSSITAHTGKLTGKTPGEIFGTPVGVDHTRPLTKALTMTWKATGLTATQIQSVVLVKWDPTSASWLPQSVPARISGATISASVSSFSFWDWAANVSQTVGQWTGSRTGPPTCSGKHYPSWVEGVVNTDDDTKAAAILTCFERGDGTNITAKVSNNRTFTQQLTMTNGGQNFAKESLGDQGDYSVDSAVYEAAHAVFDTKTTFTMPPLAATSVQFARPLQPGNYVIQAQAQVNPKTIFTDILDFEIDQIDVGAATDNPLLGAFLTALYECGGKELLHTNNTGARAAVLAVVKSIASCGGKLADPDSNEFGGQFEDAVQTALRNATAADKERIAKSYRLLREAGSALKLLTIGEVAFYLSDQLANAYVGPLALSVRGRGTPQQLGVWKPTCSNTKTDARALYQNLALQDAFADTSKALWQFTDWDSDAVTAVQPLTGCSSSYRSSLANQLPRSWEDRKAAGIVADHIRALDTPVAASTTSTPAPPKSTTTASAQAGNDYLPGSSFDDICYVAAPFAPSYTSTSIQMTMSCRQVPQSKWFLEQVVYDDPTFRVTPSTGNMHVMGQVIDTSHSAYGYNILEVQASNITVGG